MRIIRINEATFDFRLTELAAMSALPPVVLIPTAQLALLTGSLHHLAHQLSSGCPMAGQRAELLLEHLAQDQGLPADLLQACQRLQTAVVDGAHHRL